MDSLPLNVPSVSIVILTYNTRALLVACLASIREQAIGCEVIVVDNDSTDGSAAAVRSEFPEVVLVVNPVNAGFAQGMNIGLQQATGEFVLALNADTTILAETIPTLLEAAASLPRAGILGPVQYLPGEHGEATGPMLASAFADPSLLREAARLLAFTDSVAARLALGPWRRPSNEPPRAVDWLMGAALLFRRACLRDIGGFDEGQFMYGEDWDICMRARRAGWAVYLVPQSRIVHHENAAGRQYFGAGRRARVLLGNLHFHEVHFGVASRRALAALHLVGAGLRLGLLLPLRVVKGARAGSAPRWNAHVEEARAAARGMRRTKVPAR